MERVPYSLWMSSKLNFGQYVTYITLFLMKSTIDLTPQTWSSEFGSGQAGACTVAFCTRDSWSWTWSRVGVQTQLDLANLSPIPLDSPSNILSITTISHGPVSSGHRDRGLHSCSYLIQRPHTPFPKSEFQASFWPISHLYHWIAH
jgi:hypothetical protein